MVKLEEAVTNNEEGILIKDYDSCYAFDERNSGWYKLKPDYVDGIMTEIDLVIVGGYFRDSRDDMISKFLCAAKKGDDKFTSICVVSSGYSKKELYELYDKLSTQISNSPFRSVEYGAFKPDVYFNPLVSKCLQIKAAEAKYFSNTNKFFLRFPRIERIRYDKSPHDCTTEKELIEIITVIF